MNERPTHIDLFSGIGGFALAAAWAGFKTVAFCEIEPYCRAVIKKNFAAADASGERQRETGQRGERSTQRPDGIRPELHTDIRKFDGRRYAGTALLTAGVPCQPASQAGKRRGRADDRWLWPEALRILGEAKPTWAVFENPLGLVTLEQGVVLEDLLSEVESIGYEVAPPIIIPACAVKATHQRFRVFIVAHLVSRGTERRRERCGPSEGRGASCPIAGLHNSNTDACEQGLSQSECGDVSGQDGHDEGRTTPEFCWPKTDFGLLRTIHGVSSRMDRRGREPNRRQRIHALGNSVVPAQAYPILKAIREVI